MFSLIESVLMHALWFFFFPPAWVGEEEYHHDISAKWVEGKGEGAACVAFCTEGYEAPSQGPGSMFGEKIL